MIPIKKFKGSFTIFEQPDPELKFLIQGPQSRYLSCILQDGSFFLFHILDSLCYKFILQLIIASIANE